MKKVERRNLVLIFFIFQNHTVILPIFFVVNLMHP